jgi:hypothetical protein
MGNRFREVTIGNFSVMPSKDGIHDFSSASCGWIVKRLFQKSTLEAVKRLFSALRRSAAAVLTYCSAAEQPIIY